ncbi:hypothetical protein V8F06_013046 [Rhypophila decipiens]
MESRDMDNGSMDTIDFPNPDLQAQPEAQPEAQTQLPRPSPVTRLRRILSGNYNIPTWDEDIDKYTQEMPIMAEPNLVDNPTYEQATAEGHHIISEDQRPTIVFLAGTHITTVTGLASFLSNLGTVSQTNYLQIHCYINMFGHGAFGLLALCYWLCLSQNWETTVSGPAAPVATIALMVFGVSDLVLIALRAIESKFLDWGWQLLRRRFWPYTRPRRGHCVC